MIKKFIMLCFLTLATTSLYSAALAGSSAFAVKKDGSTCLHEFAVRGSIAAIKEACSVGADPNAVTKFGWTPLYLAAGYLTPDSYVKNLLATDVDVTVDKYYLIREHLDTQFNNNNSKLTETIESIRVLAVKALLAAGADKNLAGPDGLSPLLIAAHKGHIEIVKVLLAAGADKNLAGSDGWSPLHRAASKGRVETVKVLLAAGADQNLAGSSGATPLHIAAQTGHIEVTKLLLAAKADVHIKDNKFGMTALDIAKTRLAPNPEIIELLESACDKK